MYKNPILVLILPFLFSCATVTEDTVSRFESRCPEMTTEERVAHTKLPYYRPPPTYPRDAANNGIEGYAEFEFDVSISGMPINIGVIESYPSDIFVNAALRSVRGYKYEVKMENGQPVIDYCQNIIVQFQFG